MVLSTYYSLAQTCSTDSNFFSINYAAAEPTIISDAIVTRDNEIVTLGQYGTFGSFVSKFTAQGNVIWSKDYAPDYPRITWLHYPWYENTSMSGILPAANGSFYVYGSSFEHGKSLNNVEDPPGHWVGLILNIDKFGNVARGKYFGNWRTNYTVNSVIETSDGKLIVYLKSLQEPFITKVLCVTVAGDILWAVPLQTIALYNDVLKTKPVLCQLKNGNIVVARVMVRNIADTIFYPFTPPIILPAPLNYFHLFELDGKTGSLLWEKSYQCPTLTNTNVSNTFTPQLKHIKQLPDESISLLADMFLPTDNERFYAHKIFSRRAVNFVTDQDGFLKNFIAYRPQNGSGNLEAVQQTANSGERLILMKDSANEKIIAFRINNNNQVTWKNAYRNAYPSESSKIAGVSKNNNKGLVIFQSNTNSFDFQSSVTSVSGYNACTALNTTLVEENVLWTWLVEKVHLFTIPAIVDFRYSDFNTQKKVYPVAQNTNCEYQYVCCKDFIDSVNINNVTICPGEIFTLPDNTKIKDSGTYYAILKTQKGCDSVLFYNVKQLKSPLDLTTSPDTCLNNASTIQIRASEGYGNYLWNTTSSADPFYKVNQPGMYTVTVKNKCGTKTNHIEVYSNCDFAVYFPSAFTPNKDLVNDILKVPRQNKNRLNRLSIYNRYGQLIFKTSRIEEGWDGFFKGTEQPAGVYIYFLEMEGLAGKKINQKGTVVLMR